MLNMDWIFEGIIDWIAGIVCDLMDSVSSIFLSAIGTDMTVMEEYFPFLDKAFFILQYTAWAILFLIAIWQLFKCFGGPIVENEHPWQLIVRSTIFAVLIWFSKPIFEITLDIARAPYTALMGIEMTSEDFTFAGIEVVLANGITTMVSVVSIVGTILLLILEISLGWNYFKLLLEAVERYVVVGILCYTSPLAYCMGGAKATAPVFKSWCRMVGSQLLLLVLNVWFLRAFNSATAHFMINAGTLENGKGNVFLWLFCALAFLKTAQKMDNYLASIGLNVAQTGSSMGMEMLMAAKVLTSFNGHMKSAGNVFHGSGSSITGMTSGGVLSGLTNMFRSNSYVRDAVVDGGMRMGAGGGLGFIGRTFGSIAAKNGAVLNSESISSVASRMPNVSGKIAGDIANRSLCNYMPQFNGRNLNDTQITGGHISTTAIGTNGKTANIDLYNTSQYEKPQGPHSIVTATDGSQWYQLASGAGSNDFYGIPEFTGSISETEQISTIFPDADNGTLLRTVENGVLEASNDSGNTLWYNSAMFEEPQAPHSIVSTVNGVDWYAMNQHGTIPQFECGEEATEYNQSLFQNFIPSYEREAIKIDDTHRVDGYFEIGHKDGSGTLFYDSAIYNNPSGDYQTYEDNEDHQWFAIDGETIVEKKPVYEDGQPVYEGNNVKTVLVESVKYKNHPNRYEEPKQYERLQNQTPRRKN